MENDMATGTRMQGSWPLLENRNGKGKGKTGKGKGKGKGKVTIVEKDSEKARAKIRDGALQPRHRPALQKASGPTTGCVTFAGSGATLAKIAHSQTVGKQQPDPSKHRAMRRQWHRRQRA